MNLIVAGLLIATALTLLARVAARRRRAEWAKLMREDRHALDGEHRGVPTIASVAHLDRTRPAPLDELSPYRLMAADSDPAVVATRERARAALLNARWLLMAAVEERAAKKQLRQRGRTRRADEHAQAQTRFECEALQCIFEAEALLQTRIVRDPTEPARFGRFYGEAEGLLRRVAEFIDRAFAADGRRKAG